MLAYDSSHSGRKSGGLVFLSEKSVPKAIAASLGSFGLSVPVVHKLIG